MTLPLYFPVNWSIRRCIPFGRYWFIGVLFSLSPAAPAQTLQVDGQTVRYEPTPELGAQFATFHIETPTARDEYLLDCEVKEFLWTKNFERATNERTDRTADAQWRVMNPKSRIANAVYAAICPQLLSAIHSPPAAPPPPVLTPPAAPSIPTHNEITAAESIPAAAPEVLPTLPALMTPPNTAPPPSPNDSHTPVTNDAAPAPPVSTYIGLLKVQPEQSLLISLNKTTGAFQLFVFETQSIIGQRILSVCQDLNQCQFTGTIRPLNIAPPSEFALAVTHAAEIITLTDVSLVMF